MSRFSKSLDGNAKPANILFSVLISMMALALMAGGAAAAITSITITAPTGGEYWSGTQSITWTATGCAPGDKVKIYWGKGGTIGNPAVSAQITEVDCSPASYSWSTTGMTDGSDYQIKVKYSADSDIFAYSDAFFTIDNTAPTASISDVSTTWVTYDEITVGCSDTLSSCISTKQYYFDSDGTCSSTKTDYSNSTTSGTVNVTATHNDYLCLWVEDNAGNHDTEVSIQLMVDADVPTITDDYAYDGIWVNSTQTVTLDPQDTGGSGVKEVKYCEGAGCDPSVVGSPLSSPYQLSYTTTQNTIVRYQVWDNADNPSAVDEFNVKIDKELPVVEANGPYSGDEDTSISFSSAGSSDSPSGIATYSWDFNDGETSDEENPSHTYDDPGTYTVTLTITDNAGNSDFDTADVTVNDKTSPSFTSAVSTDLNTVYKDGDTVNILATITDNSGGTLEVIGDFTSLEKSNLVFYATNADAESDKSTTEKHSGDFSALLNLNDIDPNTDARVIWDIGDLTLNQITSISYWFYNDADTSGTIPDCWFDDAHKVDCVDVVNEPGYAGPYLGFALDTNSNDVADSWVIEHKFATDSFGSWQERSLGDTTYFHVAGTGAAPGWSTTTPGQLSAIKADGTLGPAKILEIKIYFGGWNPTQITLTTPLHVFVDDVEVNGVDKPIPFDLAADNGDDTYTMAHTIVTGPTDGDYNPEITATDAAENSATDTSLSLTIDNTNPTIQTDTLTSPNGGEFLAGGSTETITWDDSDIADTNLETNPITLYYSTDSGSTWTQIATDEANNGNYDWTVPSIDDAEVRIKIEAADEAGNTASDTSDADFTVDSTSPSAPTYNTDEAQWFNSNPTLDIDFGDNLALEKAEYKVDSGGTYSTIADALDGTSYTTNWSITPSDWSTMSEGAHYLYFRITDDAGNQYETSDDTAAFTMKKDTEVPTTTDSGTDTNWHDSDVTVTLTCDDGTGIGCDQTYYCVDQAAGTCNPTTLGTSPVTSVVVSAEGENYVRFYSVDPLGNTETVKNATNTVKIDKSLPQITGVTGDVSVQVGQAKEISATITDSASGVASATIHYTPIGGTETTASMTDTGGNIWKGTIPAQTENGTVPYYITAADNAENPATSDTYNVIVYNFVLSLAEEWSLISVPNTLADKNTDSVFPAFEVWEYLPEETVSWAGPTTIDPGIGYWIYNAVEATDVGMNYQLCEGGYCIPSEEIPLNSGWNLIGHMCDVDKSIGNVFPTELYDYLLILSYDSTADEFKTYAPFDSEQQDFTDLEPGEGYWLFVTSSNDGDLYYTNVCI